jgi:hypothetical protein
MEPREGIAEMGLGLARIAECQRGLSGMVVRLARLLGQNEGLCSVRLPHGAGGRG